MQLKNSYPFNDQVRIEIADYWSDGRYAASSLLRPVTGGRMGAVLVVGGPQYRVGSHRQYFDIAHACASAGFPTLIFDYRGLGDSDGEPRQYYEINDDIRCAIDMLISKCRDVEAVVLFGLCDGATASLLYGANDDRVAALAIANPWLEGGRSHARSRLKEYYAARLRSRGFWADLLRGRLRTSRSLLRVMGVILRAVGKTRQQAVEMVPSPQEVAGAAKAFKGPMHLILSGRDVTAKVFTGEMNRQADWAELKTRSGFSSREVAGADHTFSRSAWHRELVDEVVMFLAHCADPFVDGRSRFPGGQSRAAPGAPETP